MQNRKPLSLSLSLLFRVEEWETAAHSTMSKVLPRLSPNLLGSFVRPFVRFLQLQRVGSREDVVVSKSSPPTTFGMQTVERERE
jgi:hypothetical protein